MDLHEQLEVATDEATFIEFVHALALFCNKYLKELKQAAVDVPFYSICLFYYGKYLFKFH